MVDDIVCTRKAYVCSEETSCLPLLPSSARAISFPSKYCALRGGAYGTLSKEGSVRRVTGDSGRCVANNIARLVRLFV